MMYKGEQVAARKPCENALKLWANKQEEMVASRKIKLYWHNKFDGAKAKSRTGKNKGNRKRNVNTKREALGVVSGRVFQLESPEPNIIIMLANPTGILHELTTQLLIEKRYESAFRRGLERYQIRQYNICGLTPSKILEMHTSLTTKFYFNRAPGNSESWYENELRVYIWLLVGYSYLEDRCISEMNEADWKIFSEIFNHRNPQMFEFQALTILKRETKYPKWSNDQYSLLDSIIKAKSIKNKWNQIAKELFIRSGKRFFRTPKQCREYWINHLDPVPVKGDWTAAEDYNLVQIVISSGKKWSRVSKELGGTRTEHMVKNRFKSLYHFEAKRRSGLGKELESEQAVIEGLSKKLEEDMQEEEKLNAVEQRFARETSEGEERLKIQSAADQQPLIKDGEESLFQFMNDMEEDQQIHKHEEDYPIKAMATFNSPRNEMQGLFEDFNIRQPFTLEDCLNTFFNEPEFLAEQSL